MYNPHAYRNNLLHMYKQEIIYYLCINITVCFSYSRLPIAFSYRMCRTADSLLFSLYIGARGTVWAYARLPTQHFCHADHNNIVYRSAYQ